MATVNCLTVAETDVVGLADSRGAQGVAHDLVDPYPGNREERCVTGQFKLIGLGMELSAT